MTDRRSVLSVAVVVALGLGSLALPVGPRYLARSAAFLLAAVLSFTLGVRRRPEPARSWQVMGVGLFAVAGAWAARAVDVEAIGMLGAWPDLPAGLGLVLIGVGLLLAGRGRRERVALLDGAILAGALLTFIWATLIDPSVTAATTDRQLAAAGLHTAGATLIVSVAVAITLSRRRSFQRSYLPAVGAVSALLFGGVGWAWRGLVGEEQAALGGVSWLIAPLLVVVVVSSAQPRREQEEAPAGILTTVRFGLLVLLTLMPALTVLILNVGPRVGSAEVPLTLGLWVTVVSVVLLAARVGATTGFAIEDERALTNVRHQRLTEHSADMVALVSLDGDVFYVSPSMTRVLGLEGEDILGTSFARLIAAEDRDEFVARLARASAAKGTPVSVGPRVLTSDGRILPVEGTVTDLSDVVDVAGVVVTLRDISARVALEGELRKAALEDPLTGLANRTLLTERARHALSQRTEGGAARVALLYVDVDDFKTINDGLGHQAGDRVLQVVADRLRAVVRDFDTAGRLGGDEFAILLQSLEADDPMGSARVVAERLLGRMEEPIEVAGESVRMRISIGLALGAPDMTVDELIQNADVAMYSAKQSGKELALYDEGMETRARRRLLLTQDLEAALGNDGLALGYQPIVDLKTRKVVSVEALLRWEHERLGPIAAAEVEELAVRGGLADELTTWVLGRVRQDQRVWQEQFGGPLVVAVNLAAQQLSDRVIDIFDEVFGDRLPGTSPNISVELTESALLRDAETVGSLLGRLRARGATIAIDDFGTGYASLSHLRRLSVDVLKIDREFIAELTTENATDSFAALIQDLARRLDLITVAEGIETNDQCAAAAALGCQRGQGHLFGRAVPITSLALDHAMRLNGVLPRA